MSEHNNFEHRVSKLEAWKENQDKVSERLAASLDRLNAVLAEVTLKLDRLAHTPSCPKPGLCLELEETVGEHATALRELLDDKQFVVRGWKAIGVVAGVATGIVATLYAAWEGISSILQHLKRP